MQKYIRELKKTQKKINDEVDIIFNRSIDQLILDMPIELEIIERRNNLMKLANEIQNVLWNMEGN